jgi:diaminohydroxyphosphoribosylaminopyrimidine deaminase / 5-amino-6-(5-phosphoribosylamino)uracil reductase
MDDLDTYFMRRALAEAARGRGAVEPNPMVGAVLVRDGRVIAVGHHARYGGPHAEVEALRAAGEAALGATLFVTLEPCCHHGKTPPCTSAVIDAGIARVVVAMRDPFPRVAGGGFAQLREAGISVEVGNLEDEAQRLNAPYLKRLAMGRPFVTAKWAMTLDGRIATASGHSRWISNPRSRAVVHELRGRMDAILVGIGTAVADDPSLTARPPGPRVATRVVLDSAARLPIGSVLCSTARGLPTLVATTERAPSDRVAALEAKGCEVLKLPGEGSVPPDALLAELGRRGMTNVLVEGGGRVLGAFLDAGEVDAVDVFIAPIIEGGPPHHVPFLGSGAETMDLARRLERQELATLAGDVWLRGEFPHPWLAVPKG